MLFSLNSFHCSSYITPTWPIYGLGRTTALRFFFTLLLGSLDYDVSMIHGLDDLSNAVQFNSVIVTRPTRPWSSDYQREGSFDVGHDLQIWEWLHLHARPRFRLVGILRLGCVTLGEVRVEEASKFCDWKAEPPKSYIKRSWVYSLINI